MCTHGHVALENEVWSDLLMSYCYLETAGSDCIIDQPGYSHLRSIFLCLNGTLFNLKEPKKQGDNMHTSYARICSDHPYHPRTSYPNELH